MEVWKGLLVLCMFAVWQTTDGLPVESHPLVRAARSTSSCKTPDNLERLLTSVNSITDGVTYLRSVNWTGTGMFAGELNVDQISQSLTQFTDSTVCSVANTQPDAPIRARSLCPWVYNSISLKGYYPNYMVEAKCKCEKCIGNDVNRCELVTSAIRVLKKQDECIDGFEIYKEETIEMPVACVCAKPRIARQASSVTTMSEPLPDFSLDMSYDN